MRAAGSTLDWQRLLRRFDGHWQVLLSHLVLFDYIYPSERHQIPNWVVQQLTTRTLRLDRTKAGGLPVCRGTYLSRAQYLADITDWNYQDARVVPAGPMTPEQADIWTAAAIEDDRVTISVASESLNGDAPAA